MQTEMGIGKASQQGDNTAPGEGQRDGMARRGDGEAEHRENAAADHAADADRADFRQVQLTGFSFCHASFAPIAAAVVCPRAVTC